MTDHRRILVFGSIVQDLISYTDNFPRPGESVRGKSFHAGPGGKGANQAVAAARLGANVTMVARVGNDMFGDSNLASLRESGVNVEGVEKTEKTTTATATITVNAQGENSIVVTLGANEELDATAADRAASLVRDSAMVITQAEVCPSGNRSILEIARLHGVKTFFNPAPGDRSLDSSILQLVDIVCVNENEAEFLTGLAVHSTEDAHAAASRMLEMGPQHALITMGGKGVIVASRGGEIHHVDVPTVTAVDTTGAGDCFCGSLAALLVEGHSLVSATRVAARVAALSVLRKGTQSSYWTKQEIIDTHPDTFAL